ncbi:alpha/beta-hydrolase [Atractiella rhizophila]|nr:alpha/beta-hydrolase [Atractiella rhizophila]
MAREKRIPESALDDVQKIILNLHLREMKQHSQTLGESWLKLSKNNAWIALARYNCLQVVAFVKMVIFTPASLFFDPLSFIVYLIIIPIVCLGLFLSVILLTLVEVLHIAQLLKYVTGGSENGLSIIQWADTNIFGEESDFVFETAHQALTDGVKLLTPRSEADQIFSKLRIFDLRIAEALLLASALVYERHTSQIQEASRILRTAKSPDDNLVKQHILDSEKKIHDQAAKWGLRFMAICELTSKGGPFIGIFYNSDYIIVSVKGTTPSDFSEFLVDASIAREDATQFLGGGSVHQGFYSALFSGKGHTVDCYGDMIRTINLVAQSMRRDKPLSLWITGHSLGSALAALLFARLMHSPADLHENCVLRDAYVFGTPRLGDAQFCAEYEASMLVPIDKTNVLWRVVNKHDVVTMVPPGLADIKGNRPYLPKWSTANYGHIGSKVVLDGKAKEGYRLEKKGSWGETSEVRVTKGKLRGGGELMRREKRGVEKWIRYLPGPILNHFPGEYMRSMRGITTDSKSFST